MMQGRLAKRVVNRVDGNIRFVKSLIDKPRSTGAVWPTSGVTARRMASLIDPANGAPVLELGPGTGAITKAILQRGVKPENLHAIEYVEDFLPKLEEDFPGVNFIHGDAFHLDEILPDLQGRKFDAVLSGIPLLNFPVDLRISLIETALKYVNPGRPVVQFSYGPSSPVPPDAGNYTVEAFDWIMRNVPPARLWVYRRTGAS